MGLGRALAQQFFREYMPSAYGQVAAFFHQRGAYAKFKELLERNGLLDAWHAHEANEVVTLPLNDVVHSHSITRLSLAGPRASFLRTASG